MPRFNSMDRVERISQKLSGKTRRNFNYKNPKTVDFENVICTKVSSSGLAIFVIIDGAEEIIPLSQVHADSEVYQEGDEGKLVVTEWIAMQKGLI